MDDVSLVQVLVDVGFKDDGTLRDALAVVFAESGGRCDARNTAGNSPPSIDRGLFQINSYWHSEVSDACAYDCLCNAQAAYRISNGGTNWTQWATWPAAAHRHYPDADRALTAWRNVHPADDFAHVPQWQWDRALDRVLRMSAGVEGQNFNGDQFNFEQGKIDEIIKRLDQIEARLPKAP